MTWRPGSSRVACWLTSSSAHQHGIGASTVGEPFRGRNLLRPSISIMKRIGGRVPTSSRKTKHDPKFMARAIGIYVLVGSIGYCLMVFGALPVEWGLPWGALISVALLVATFLHYKRMP